VAHRAAQTGGIVERNDQPVYMFPDVENGEDVTRVFTSDDEASAWAETQAQADLGTFAGVWSDVDWDEMEQALYEIRHSNPPTPPIDDL
jgi:hypothetical protein